MATRTPPRFVPTLTEVVSAPASPGPAAPPDEEQLVHRILQRVDVTLERRLREAIASIVLEHTRTLAPELRAEVESVVREVVSQAVADELGTSGTSPTSTAR